MRCIGAWVALLVAACASSEPRPEPDPEARLRDARQAAQTAREQDSLWHSRYKQGLATRLQWLPYDGEAEITRVEAERWTQLARLRRRARAGGLDPHDVERRAALIHYTTDLLISEVDVRTAKRILDVAAQGHAQGLLDREALDKADRAHHEAQNARHEARMGRYTFQMREAAKLDNPDGE